MVWKDDGVAYMVTGLDRLRDTRQLVTQARLALLIYETVVIQSHSVFNICYYTMLIRNAYFSLELRETSGKTIYHN